MVHMVHEDIFFKDDEDDGESTAVTQRLKKKGGIIHQRKHKILHITVSGTKHGWLKRLI